MGTEWARTCETEIAQYFQYLIDCIKIGDSKSVRKLLDAFHEVDEVALGYSSGEPRGRGVGPRQAREIQAAFEQSRAGKSGDIRDIADCALMIPGVNRDKISDITANILKNQLIVFTQEQCRLLGIPMRRVPVNKVFDHETFEFKSYFADLPLINNRPKILLPISSVRHVPELSKEKYYRNYVLEFLKAEHEHAGDSLASVLRNGRVVVRIKDLRQKYAIGAEFLYEFSKQHPNVLGQYKKALRQSAAARGGLGKLNAKRKLLTAEERIAILAEIEPGNEGAHDYHKLAYDSLINIFGKRLSRPYREREINEGRKRIDIVFDNAGRTGFFGDLDRLHHVHCPKIFAECKNYGREIGNPEFDQLVGRFSRRRGLFGILLCRSVENFDLMIRRCRDIVTDDKGFVIVLTDTDLGKFLHLRQGKNEQGIDDFLTAKFDELIM